MKLSRIFEPSIVNEVSLATYCLFIYAITTLPTPLVVGISMAVLQSLELGGADGNTGSGNAFDPMDFFGISVVAPVLETFVLACLHCRVRSPYVEQRDCRLVDDVGHRLMEWVVGAGHPYASAARQCVDQIQSETKKDTTWENA